MTTDTKRTPPQIIRTEDIVVDTFDKDDYGNLIVLDKAGNEHKIGVKRQHLFPFFQAGIAIHLSYASLTDKKTGKLVEYIANAIPLEQLIKSAPSKVETAKPPEFQKPIKTTPDAGRNRAFSISYAKDLCMAGKIEVDSLISWATVMEKYISGDFIESESDIVAKFVAKYGRKKEKAEP